jgi:Uma2 family endonuclease
MVTGTRKADPRRSGERTDSELPPLENGDHLTRSEFERRYDAMPGLKKAELIEGVVYMPSPVSHANHSHPHFRANGWLYLYSSLTPGTQGGDNGSIRLDLENMPQPDLFLIISPSHGGRVRISEDDYVEGAPELIVEIASSSASYDLHEKSRVYRRNGVSEYVVWRTRDAAIDWFALREGRYEPLARGEDGTYRSEVFPGLWLDPDALVRSDHARVLAVVQQGAATPEHAAFVERLRREAARLAGGQGGPRP